MEIMVFKFVSAVVAMAWVAFTVASENKKAKAEAPKFKDFGFVPGNY